MIRRGVLLALALSLASCGGRGERGAFTESRIPASLGPIFWPPRGWAWGLIQIAPNPPQRYGVAAPVDEPPLAQALMLPGYGGLAEGVFQAANAMAGRGVQVWALDEIGQGGSGRIALPRDLGHVDSFDGDVAGVQSMVAEVIRPARDTPLVVIADGTAAPVLLRALQQGLPGVTAVMLTGPRLEDGKRVHRALPTAIRAIWLKLDRWRAPGAGSWRRKQALAAPGSPAFVRHSWQLANPDLRMGGPSLGWRAAFDELNASVTAEGLTRIRLQVRVLVDPSGSAADRASAVRLCSALPHCALAVADPGQWPQREADFAAQAAAAAALSIPSPGR